MEYLYNVHAYVYVRSYIYVCLIKKSSREIRKTPLRGDQGLGLQVYMFSVCSLLYPIKWIVDWRIDPSASGYRGGTLEAIRFKSYLFI